MTGPWIPADRLDDTPGVQKWMPNGAGAGGPAQGVKRWDGTQWKVQPIRVWDGTTWKGGLAKTWTGSAWKVL